MIQKKILVTGGAGFLGANLCRKLVRGNYHIIVVDDLSSGRIKNIQDLLDLNNFEFIKHDIVFPINLKVDQIFNLACPASPPQYQDNPIQTTKTSIIGALNMLELARENDARILQASTSEVYGDPIEHPQRENYKGNVNPIGVRACYDESKRCAESLFFDYHRKYGVDIKVVRIFNTYGPYMDPGDGRVISNFVIRALKNEPLEVYGDGKQTRSFCYVDDMIEGILTMMNLNDNFKGPVNLGNPIEMDVLEVAKMVIKLTGSLSKIVFKRFPIDDPKKRRPDISLAKNSLNWMPKTKFQNGLQKTIRYFQNCLNSSEG